MGRPDFDMPVLLTPRLRLRPILKADSVGLFRVFGDPEAMRFWDAPFRRTVAETAQLIRSFATDAPAACCGWALTYRDEQHPIGVVRLIHADRSSRRAELRFILARPHWHQGLMAEALHRVVDHGFVDLGLNRLEAGCHPDDARCRSLLQRLGFQWEGTLRQKVFVDPCYRDMAMFSLLAHEWPSGSTRALGRPRVSSAAG